MSLENEKRYLLLLSSYQLEEAGVYPNKEQVLNNIESKDWILLDEADKQKKDNRNELVWRNDLAFTRKHLELDGLYNSGERNNWGITTKGEECLKELHKILSAVPEDLRKVSLKAISDAESILDDYLEYEDFEIIKGKEKYAFIKTRVNQGSIRKKALKRHGAQCALCKMGFEPSLIASHIKEWAASSETEKGDLDNILLLCPNHDALFDKHYISFDDNGKILISSKLSIDDRTLLNIKKDMKIEINDNMRKYMEWHRKKMKN